MIKERHIEVKNKVRNGMPYIEYSINSQTEKLTYCIFHQ